MLTRPPHATLPIRRMRLDDIEAGMDLVRTAGWNQTDADWRFMLTAGEGFGIEADGQLVASSVILHYPPAIGWIGMVLVATEFRRRGLATLLMKNAMAVITGAGRIPMLDATPDGREVYAALGFRDLEGIGRWRGTGAALDKRRVMPPMTDALADQGLTVAAAAFGADRQPLLDDLRSRPGALATANGGGWLWSRAGRTATQIGPVVAESAAGAIALCAAALDQVEGPVILDIPDRETELTGFLSDRGFSLERRLTRMALNGTPATLGSTTRAIAGPELG